MADDQAIKERAVVATLLSDYPKLLPISTRKLLRHAPESFDDPRLGIIAAAIRDTALEGPVHSRTVQQKLASMGKFDDAGGALFYESLTADALPITIAESEAGLVWDAYEIRRAASVGVDLTAALVAAPKQAAAIISGARRALESLENESGKNGLPPWVDARSFVSTPLPSPPEIVKGLLHRGCKMVVGGASKARKSWLLLDLGVSVSCGAKCLAYPTTQARVLFVNFELPDWSIHHRLQAIAKAKDLSLSDRLVIWNLRGHSSSYEVLLPALTARIKGQEFGLVILDPSYKLLGQADENSARDIAGLLNSFEALTVETGAALAFSAHFAKGNASGKEAMDRISGSGVFARDPDSILVLTALQTEDAYSVEAILRTLPPIPPFAVQWDYPLMRPAPDLDPCALKQPGPKKQHDPLDLLRCIGDSTQDQPVSVSQWATDAGLARGTLREYLTVMRQRGWIGSVGEGLKARKFITKKGREELLKCTGGVAAI